MSVNAALQALVHASQDSRLEQAARTDIVLRCALLTLCTTDLPVWNDRAFEDANPALRCAFAWCRLLESETDSDRIVAMVQALAGSRWCHSTVPTWHLVARTHSLTDKTLDFGIMDILGADSGTLSGWLARERSRYDALWTLLGEPLGGPDPEAPLGAWMDPQQPIDVSTTVENCLRIFDSSWTPPGTLRKAMPLPGLSAKGTQQVASVLRGLHTGPIQYAPIRIHAVTVDPIVYQRYLLSELQIIVDSHPLPEDYDLWVDCVRSVIVDSVRLSQISIVFWLEIIAHLACRLSSQTFLSVIRKLYNPLLELLSQSLLAWGALVTSLSSAGPETARRAIAELLIDPRSIEQFFSDSSLIQLAPTHNPILRRNLLAAALVVAIPEIAPLVTFPHYPLFECGRDRSFALLASIHRMKSDLLVTKGWLTHREWSDLRTLSASVCTALQIQQLPVTRSHACWDSLRSLGAPQRSIR